MTMERTLKVLEMFLDKQCSIERTLNHMDTTDVEIWDAVYTATKALSAIEDIKAEIAEYKDDKIIHLERNEMVDTALKIIDRHISGKESE